MEVVSTHRLQEVPVVFFNLVPRMTGWGVGKCNFWGFYWILNISPKYLSEIISRRVGISWWCLIRTESQFRGSKLQWFRGRVWNRYQSPDLLSQLAQTCSASALQVWKNMRPTQKANSNGWGQESGQGPIFKLGWISWTSSPFTGDVRSKTIKPPSTLDFPFPCLITGRYDKNIPPDPKPCS